MSVCLTVRIKAPLSKTCGFSCDSSFSCLLSARIENKSTTKPTNRRRDLCPNVFKSYRTQNKIEEMQSSIEIETTKNTHK